MPLYLPHFDLQKFNSLASPVVANYYVSAKDTADLIHALAFGKERQLPSLVLGGGSNIVLHDDFPGLVIHLQMLGIELVREDDDYVYVKAMAGENWHEFVEYCLSQGYWGLENLSLIPGTVGAAPIQNIGAYGIELKDVFYELTALDKQSTLSVTFTHASCQFNYRDSVFKGLMKDKYIITSVTFKLSKSPRLHLDYPALAAALADYPSESITPRLVSQVVCNIRQSKLPNPTDIPNVGSFFKNPIVSYGEFERIKREYPHIPFYPVNDEQVKLAAAWLIDSAGWKGYQDLTTGAAVHHQQALVLTNPRKIKASGVLALADKIKYSVFETFAVSLEQEPISYP